MRTVWPLWLLLASSTQSRVRRAPHIVLAYVYQDEITPIIRAPENATRRVGPSTMRLLVSWLIDKQLFATL